MFNILLHVSTQQFKKKNCLFAKTNFETFDVKHQNFITDNFPLIMHFANEIGIILQINDTFYLEIICIY